MEPKRLSLLCGIYSNEDPTNLMALYLSGTRKNLLRIFYKALLASGDEKIVIKSKPLDARFLLDILLSKSIVTERIDKRLERDFVNEIPAKSVLYFGRERDSFKNSIMTSLKQFSSQHLTDFPKQVLWK